jgi:hypothetical protein
MLENKQRMSRHRSLLIAILVLVPFKTKGTNERGAMMYVPRLRQVVVVRLERLQPELESLVELKAGAGGLRLDTTSGVR